MFYLFSVFFIRCLGVFLNFLIGLVVAWNLDTLEADKFFFSLTWVQFLFVLSKFGQDIAVVKVSGKGTLEDKVKALSVSFMISGSLWLFVYFTFLSLFYLDFFKDRVSPLVVFSSLFFLLIWLQAAYFKSIGSVFKANFFESTVIPFIFFLLYGLCFLFFEQFSFYTLYFSASIFALVSCWSVGFPNFIKAEFSYILGQVRFGFPLAVAGILDFILMWFSSFVLFHYGEDGDISKYNIAYRISLLISLVLVVTNTVTVKKYASAFEENDIEKVQRVARFSSAAMATITLPFFSICMFCPCIILSYFGNTYCEASNILRILSVGQFVNIFCGSVGNMLMMSDNSTLFRNITFFTAVVSIILSITFVPLYGAVAAAVIASFSLSLKNLLCATCVCNLFKINIFPDIGFFKNLKVNASEL